MLICANFDANEQEREEACRWIPFLMLKVLFVQRLYDVVYNMCRFTQIVYCHAHWIKPNPVTAMGCVSLNLLIKVKTEEEMR